MFRNVLSLAMIMIFMGAFSVASYAECPICVKASASNSNWPERSVCQFAQGAGNLLFGWTQAFTEPVRENICNSNPCPLYKTTNGLLVGWGKAIITSGSGLLEILTFWTPVRIIPDTGCIGNNTSSSCEKKAQS